MHMHILCIAAALQLNWLYFPRAASVKLLSYLAMIVAHLRARLCIEEQDPKDIS